jgi:hypothetical protein
MWARGDNHTQVHSQVVIQINGSNGSKVLGFQVGIHPNGECCPPVWGEKKQENLKEGVEDGDAISNCRALHIAALKSYIGKFLVPFCNQAVLVSIVPFKKVSNLSQMYVYALMKHTVHVGARRGLDLLEMQEGHPVLLCTFVQASVYSVSYAF